MRQGNLVKSLHKFRSKEKENLRTDYKDMNERG